MEAVGGDGSGFAKKDVGDLGEVGLGGGTDIIGHNGGIAVVFDELGGSCFVGSADVDADSQLAFRHTGIEVGLQPAGIVGVAIGHFPTVIEDITGFFPIIGGAKILGVIEEGLGDVFTGTQLRAEGGDGQDQRAGIGRAGGVFIIDINAVEAILGDGFSALDGETIGHCIRGKAPPACVLVIPEHGEEDFDAQRMQIGDVAGGEGALYLRVIIEDGVPTGVRVDISGEDNGEGEDLFGRAAIGKTTWVMKAVGIDFHIRGGKGCCQGGAIGNGSDIRRRRPCSGGGSSGRPVVFGASYQQ